MLRFFCIVIGILSAWGVMADDWLVPNQNFRYSGGSRFPLEGWRFVFGSESNLVELSPQPDGVVPVSIKMTQVGEKPIIVYQDLAILPPGRYRFELRMLPQNGAAFALIADKSAYGKGGDSKLSLDFELDKPQTLRIHFGTAGAGTVIVSEAAMTVLSLKNSPVESEDGQIFSHIVIPDQPSDAERFAAWELGRFLFAMTGNMPGLAGRDEIEKKDRAIRIGRSALPEMEVPQSEDGFCYGIGKDGSLNLTGVNDRGTLYAVYAFLKDQGCSWTIPGKDGETIPARKKLTMPESIVRHAPAYHVRGIMASLVRFKMDGGWEYANYDELYDWAVRNGFNAMWFAGLESYDFRPWRGGSHVQTLNHAWRTFSLDSQPEWWPLVNGKREKMHVSGRYNQLCVSNPKLIDYAAEYIIDFFKKNPDYSRFSLSAEDEPCQWCGCSACRALDSDKGAGVWRPKANGEPSMPMSDRSIYFVNAVARKVAERCPEKKLEIYAYSSNITAPTRQKIAENVTIKFCYWPELYWPELIPADLRKQLKDWEKAGAKSMSIYDYDNYLYTNTLWSGIELSFKSLVLLNQQFDFKEYLPESNQDIWSNPLLYQMRAEALSGANVDDFEALILKHCRNYFGAAGMEVSNYYLDCAKRFAAGQQRLKLGSHGLLDKRNIYCAELTLNDLKQTEKYLQKAWQIVSDDPVVMKRLANIWLAHDLTVLTVLSNQKTVTRENQQQGLATYEHAKMLVTTFDLLLSQSGFGQLNLFYMPPAVKNNIMQLPVKWRFQFDSKKVGQNEKWYAVAHPEWSAISVEQDWISQGHYYHGVAWYETEINIGSQLTRVEDPAIFFGAIDGYADIYWNGELIGQQLQPPDKMWDRPFAIKIPKPVKPGKYRLTVRVEKDRAAAGIWKPVFLVDLDHSK